MKSRYLFLSIFLPFSCVASDEISDLKSLDMEASNYRKMSIECVTDTKLTKKPPAEIDTCKVLYNFTTNEYPNLKEALKIAEESARNEGESKGLENPSLREKLILIMSVKSHIGMASAVLSKVH